MTENYTYTLDRIYLHINTHIFKYRIEMNLICFLKPHTVGISCIFDCI